MSQKEPTPAQRYADAVWAADPDALSTTEAMMALCYVSHTHTAPFDRAWVVDSRLMERCKIRSKGTVSRVRDGLVSKGWLRPLHPTDGSPISAEEAKGWQRRRKTLAYLLTIPVAIPVSKRTAPAVAPAAPTIGAISPDPTTPTIGAAAPIVEPHCPDSRGLPSYDPLKELKEPPPTPSTDDQDGGGGGGEDPEVSDVLDGVAAAWGGSAKALTPHRRTVAAALARAWQPDALARHLGENPPPVILSAADLLGHRLGRLPPGPDHCGRRCCAPPPARLTAVPGPWDRPALRLRPPGECEHGAPTGNGCALCRRGIPAERDVS